MTLIYLIKNNNNNNVLFFQPIIDNDLVEDYKKKVADLINDQRIGPELRVQDFDDYVCLLNGDVSIRTKY